MVPIEGYQEKPDMDLNDIEVTENPGDIVDITKLMLARKTTSIRTRSLLYFPDTVRGRETYQVHSGYNKRDFKLKSLGHQISKITQLPKTTSLGY